MDHLKRLAAVLVLGFLVYAPLYAVPTLSFSVDGGAAVTCADGDACDANALAGVVTFIGSLGAFEVNVTTGITKPIFPDGKMDLNSVNVQAGAGAHSLVMMFSEIGYNFLGPGQLLFGGTLSGAGATIQADGYYDEGNTLFAQTSLVGTLGPFGPGAFAGSVGGPGPGVAPYSLTQVLTLTTAGPTSFSGDFELSIVPEPASVALLGGVLLLTFGAIRRKFRQS